MLKASVKQLINEQINKEFFSAYLYLDMSNYYYSKNLNGFGNWFKVQAQEERDHAEMFLNYLLENGEEVKLQTIAAPDVPFGDFNAPLVASAEHEKFITASINSIYEDALKEKDYRTTNFLNWFITEQGEEEKNSEELVQRYSLFCADPKGLYMMDAELAGRTYSPPAVSAT